MTKPLQPQSESTRPQESFQTPVSSMDDPYSQSDPQYPSTDSEDDSATSPQSFQQPASPMGDPHPGRSPKTMSELAVAALALGVISLVFSWIPVVGLISSVAAVTGFVLGDIAITKTGARGRKEGRGIAVAGTVLCVVALVVTTVVTMSMRSDVRKALDDISTGVSSQGFILKPKTKASAKGGSKATAKAGSDVPPDPSTAKVELRATATGKGSVIFGDDDADGSKQDFDGAWSKTIGGNETRKGYILMVKGDFNGGENQRMTCAILVNGQQKSYKEAYGSMGIAACDTDDMFGD